MTLRQLFASAARFLGFAPRPPKGPTVVKSPGGTHTSPDLADAFSMILANPPKTRELPLPGDYPATELEARVAHQGALADHAQACEDWVRAGCPTTANPQLDIYRQALAPFGVDAVLDLDDPVTPTGPTIAELIESGHLADYAPEALAQHVANDVGEREAARIAGLAYWVEGPKADGLFWLYHRKTPDDLAEPVRGYTRRRNAQAAAARK